MLFFLRIVVRGLVVVNEFENEDVSEMVVTDIELVWGIRVVEDSEFQIVLETDENDVSELKLVLGKEEVVVSSINVEVCVAIEILVVVIWDVIGVPMVDKVVISFVSKYEKKISLIEVF